MEMFYFYNIGLERKQTFTDSPSMSEQLLIYTFKSAGKGFNRYIMILARAWTMSQAVTSKCSSVLQVKK